MSVVSPIRLIRTAGLVIPVVVMVIAVAAFAVSLSRARTAAMYETEGVVIEAMVYGRRIDEHRDADGNRTYTHLVFYEYRPPVGGVRYGWREVSRQVYDTLDKGDGIPVRYLPNRPQVHEMPVGHYRQEAERYRNQGLIALAVCAGFYVTLFYAALPLMRAIARRRVRQARVIAHVEMPGRTEKGERLGRIRWRDETGAEGMSGLVPMLDVVGHPVGSRIRLIVDPVTGRCWWEEELADDLVWTLQGP